MTNSKDDFDRLRTLLASKRYEQPPPGYFNHFSDRVIARIEVEEFGNRSTWWSRLGEKLESKPILACAYSMAVSSLLLVGFRFSELLDQKLADPPRPGGFNLSSLPDQSPFTGAFGSVAFSERLAVSYTTSLRPALRQEPPVDLYRGSGLRMQSVGYSFGH